MTSLQLKIIGGAALVVACVVGWSWITKTHAENNQVAAEKKVAGLEGRITEIGMQNTTLAMERDAIAAENTSLRKTAKEWEIRANAWHPPPPPPPAPESDPDLAASLVGSGFVAGLKVVPDGQGVMPRADAALAYHWQGLASQIPAYVAQVATQGMAIRTGALALSGSQTELAKCDEQRGLVQREADLQRDKATAQAEATQAVKKQLQAESVKKWYYSAGAALLVVLVKR